VKTFRSHSRRRPVQLEIAGLSPRLATGPILSASIASLLQRARICSQLSYSARRHRRKRPLGEQAVLILQDPTNEQGPYFLESLTDAFRSASKICGVFAFASAAGVRLFTEDEEFQEVARKGAVDLVVGTDAVTNVRTLDALGNVALQFPRIRARAFLNPKPEGLFHPKFCFAKKQDGGRLIAGSGNLTEGGLLGNREAYSVEDLNDQGFAEVQAVWNSWTSTHEQWLLPLDDARVRARAALNNVMAREGDLPTLVATPAGGVVEPGTTTLVPNNSAVLIAEIPKWTKRPGQANFHLEDYTSFFGANEDQANRLVVFRLVNADGSRADYERDRPPVAVKSQNYRFELAAASGPYPGSTDERPIGVFVHVAVRTFLYRVLLSNDVEYANVREVLLKRALPRHRANEMHRARMTVDELRREWPTSPLWRLPATT
jgi:HKD family nuclease